MLKRKLYTKIKEKGYVEHKNALVITGARQVGKTSLLKLFWEDLPDQQKMWFDLDNPLDRKFFEEVDYNDIAKEMQLKANNPDERIYVFIDEIQSYPDITKVIKYLIDNYGIKFIVTGSSSFYLKNLFPESLSGRKFLFELFPLDFEEFLYFKGVIPDNPIDIPLYKLDYAFEKKDLYKYEYRDKDFVEYIKWGGFPEVVLTQDSDTKELVLKNIFSSFFEKDILELSDYKDVKELRELILLLARRVGSKIDVTKIASELRVQRYKVYSYLEYLENTFVIKLIPQHSKSIDRQIASGKKGYFIDTGLLNQIVKLELGVVFENSVANLLSRWGKLSYYNKGNAEIDFILSPEDRELVAFEVKLKASESDYKSLKKISKKLNIPNSYIISKEFVSDLDDIVYPQYL